METGSLTARVEVCAREIRFGRSNEMREGSLCTKIHVQIYTVSVLYVDTYDSFIYTHISQRRACK